MKDKIILKRRMVLAAIIAFIVLLFDEGALIYLTLNMPKEKSSVFIAIMAVVAVSYFLCFSYLLFNQYLRVNGQTVTECGFFKRKKVLRLAETSISSEYRNISGGGKSSSAQFIVLKDSSGNEISFIFDERAYNVLSEYCNAARQSEGENIAV